VQERLYSDSDSVVSREKSVDAGYERLWLMATRTRVIVSVLAVSSLERATLKVAKEKELRSRGKGRLGM
jgi:hypothetical protein